MTPIVTAYSFVEAINSGDPGQLAELMTEDHTFIDSDGSEHTGRDEMRQGWKGYFSMMPDFRIHVRDALDRGDTVAMFGTAEGTFDQGGVLKPENHWEVPAAWRVVVKDGRVAVWQLYVNPEPMVAISERIEAA